MLIRVIYRGLREREGIGLGDVKLAGVRGRLAQRANGSHSCGGCRPCRTRSLPIAQEETIHLIARLREIAVWSVLRAGNLAVLAV